MTIKTTILAAIVGTAFLFTQAHAGGPVMIEDETETVAPDRDNAWIVPVVLGAILIGLIASGGGDGVNVDVPDDKPQPCPKQGDGC